MSRYPLLPAPPVAPACCVGCGRHADERGFIDLGVFVELHGALYLCVTCLTEMACTVGLVAPSAGGEQRERSARALAERALMSSNAENAVLRRQLGEQVLALVHEVTLERLRLELLLAEDEKVGDGSDLQPPGGGGAGGGAGAGRQRADGPAGVPPAAASGAGGRTKSGRPRGGPRKAAESAAGPDAGGGDRSGVDVARAAAPA